MVFEAHTGEEEVVHRRLNPPLPVTTTTDRRMEVEYNLHQGGGQGHDEEGASQPFSIDSSRRRNQYVPCFVRYLPKYCCRFEDNEPLDATGCATDMYARATVFMASIFLGPALLQLASDQAQSQALLDILMRPGHNMDKRKLLVIEHTMQVMSELYRGRNTYQESLT